MQRGKSQRRDELDLTQHGDICTALLQHACADILRVYSKLDVYGGISITRLKTLNT